MLLFLLNAAPAAAVLVPSRRRLGLPAAPARAMPTAPATAVARAVAFVSSVRLARRPAVSVSRAAKSANRVGLRNTRKPTP